MSTGYTESLYMSFNVYSQGACGNVAKSVHSTERMVHFNAHHAMSCIDGKKKRSKCSVAKVELERATVHHYR